MVELGRASNVTSVETHDEETAGSEAGTEFVPPANHLRCETHDQQDRRIRAVAKRLVAQL